MPENPEPKGHIVFAIGQAYHWHQEITAKNLQYSDLAKQKNVTAGFIRRYLKLTQLCPAILKLALTGQLSPMITLHQLSNAAKHLEWQKQMQYLGL